MHSLSTFKKLNDQAVKNWQDTQEAQKKTDEKTPLQQAQAEQRKS